jgi:hypothetical protein
MHERNVYLEITFKPEEPHPPCLYNCGSNGRTMGELLVSKVVPEKEKQVPELSVLDDVDGLIVSWRLGFIQPKRK